MDEHKKQELEHRDQANQAPHNPIQTPVITDTDTQQLTTADQVPPTKETPQQIRKAVKKYIRAKRYFKASEEYLKLLDIDAHDQEALLGLAYTLDMTDRYEALYSITQRLLQIEPNSAPGLAYKARALQKLNRISEAKIANDQALLLDTNLALAWMNRSGLQILQQKYPEALRSAQRAITLSTEDARAWSNLGVALFNFNRLGESLDAFDMCLALDEDQIIALQVKAEIFCRIGRMREVIPLVKRAIRLNPLDPTPLRQGLLAYRALEMYEEMKTMSQQLLQLAPDDLFAWEQCVRALRGLGQFAEASEALDHLLALDGSNVRFITLKADSLYRLERFREAVAIAERAHRLDPDYVPANRIYDRSLRMMYQRKERNKKA